MTIGDRIKAARKSKKMTQVQLGARLGVSGSMIAQYETGVRKPKQDTVFNIARELGISYFELIGIVHYVDKLPSGQTWEELMKQVDDAIYESNLRSVSESMKRLNNKGTEAVASYAYGLTKDERYKKVASCPEQPKTPDQSESGKMEHGKEG